VGRWVDRCLAWPPVFSPATALPVIRYRAAYNDMTGGVHQVEHEDASLPHGHIALLKTQDLSYVHMKRAVDLKVRPNALARATS
jgi:hypothetical protein